MSLATLEVVISRLAARQHGLVSRAQVLGLGATVAMIEHRLATGRWIRVGGGVYRLAGVPVTWRQRALAACLIAGPQAFVSHRTAAALWGFSGFRPGPLELTVAAGRSARNSLATVHRSVHLPPADLTVHDRIPVTRPLRTLLDLASRVRPELLEEAVDDVLCRRMVELDKLVRRLDSSASRRGMTVLRAILDMWDGEGVPANVAEMRIVRVLVDAGLPPPVRQYEIWVDGELIARVDLAYPWARLAIELDSFRWHAGRGPFRSDRLRDIRLAAVGWRVLRATPEDASDGRELVAAARRILSVAA